MNRIPEPCNSVHASGQSIPVPQGVRTLYDGFAGFVHPMDEPDKTPDFERNNLLYEFQKTMARPAILF